MSEPAAGDAVEVRDGKLYSEGAEISVEEAIALGWGGPERGDAKTNLAERLRLVSSILSYSATDEATIKLIFDLKSAAEHLDDLGALLHLVLDKMGAATNRDLAADGGVGDEEGKVWAEIEGLAKGIRERKAKGSDPEPRIV